MTDRPEPSTLRRVVVLAALAGVLAGAAAIYVTGALQRKSAAVETTPAAQPVASADDAQCAAKAERAKTIAAAATGEVAALAAADPPQMLQSLAFNGPDGKPMTTADLAGKTLLMNLWATWCVPCRAEMPALDTLEKAKGGANFEVVAVNVDTGDDTKPKKFLAETNIQSLKAYRENTLSLFNDLKKRGLALGLPVTLLIDPQGCLLAHMNGPAEWGSADAARVVDAATKG